MVRNDEPSFGKFLIQKRKERDITARQIAAELDCSPVYVCDIEKDRRPVTDVILKKLCGILRLTKDEADEMYDLAAASKKTVSADLPEYIMANDIVRSALRTAKEHQVDDKEWQEFIDRILQKKE